jgi:hypothetical protein
MDYSQIITVVWETLTGGIGRFPLNNNNLGNCITWHGIFSHYRSNHIDFMFYFFQMLHVYS